VCGFVGRIRRSVGSGPALVSALPHLRGRGPDGWREWRSACGRVELLHARLAIVDPDERALQPFADGSGGVLSFNGELYNYAALRREFSGIAWRTESDTEVLLAGLQREGAAFLSRARGMLSGAWVDTVNQRVVLFRDPIGKKPLVLFHDADGSLIFGSSVQAVLALATQVPAIRPAALHEVLHQGFVEPPLGLHQGVEHLVPAEVRHFDFEAIARGTETISPSNALRYSGEPYAQVVENVSMLLRQAVSMRLGNAPFPATLLSGGIDSTVVAQQSQYYCREHGQRLRAFSLKPVIPGTQDGPYATQAARRLGIDMEWVSLPMNRVGERVLAAMDALDEPLAMPSYFVLYELVRAVRPFSKVLLTGEGGDEIFLGYGASSEWIAKAQVPTIDEVRVGPALPAWFSPWARRVAGSTLFGHMFQKADRASAEQGVELRAPLLDYDLVAYVRTLPSEALLHGGRSKALLKAQLVDWPQRFLERPKLGLAYSLRWAWLVSGFAAMRESIDPTVQSALEDALPAALCKPVLKWRNIDILRNFGMAYTLLSLSRVLRARSERNPGNI
jgi:asparagine synthase (glutamine-hydrolysing)